MLLSTEVIKNARGRRPVEIDEGVCHLTRHANDDDGVGILVLISRSILTECEGRFRSRVTFKCKSVPTPGLVSDIKCSRWGKTSALTYENNIRPACISRGRDSPKETKMSESQIR